VHNELRLSFFMRLPRERAAAGCHGQHVGLGILGRRRKSRNATGKVHCDSLPAQLEDDTMGFRRLLPNVAVECFSRYLIAQWRTIGWKLRLLPEFAVASRPQHLGHLGGGHGAAEALTAQLDSMYCPNLPDAGLGTATYPKSAGKNATNRREITAPLQFIARVGNWTDFEDRDY
jgi:hypothetical protein